MASLDAASLPRRASPRFLLLSHFAIALLVVVDFMLFQTAAAGMTLAIYFAIPTLDAGIMRGEADWTWIKIFQIVSPTITLPGGAVTVLSSYFFARRAQEETRRAQEETQRAQEEARRAQEETQRAQEETRRADEANRRADEETRLRQAAETEVQALRAQLAQANGPRRRRRRLRNSAPQEAP